MKKNIVRSKFDKVTSVKQSGNILLYLTESNKMYYQVFKEESSKGASHFVKAFNESKKISYVHRNTYHVKDIDRQTNEAWDIPCAKLVRIHKRNIHEHLHLFF